MGAPRRGGGLGSRHSLPLGPASSYAGPTWARSRTRGTSSWCRAIEADQRRRLRPPRVPRNCDLRGTSVNTSGPECKSRLGRRQKCASAHVGGIALILGPASGDPQAPGIGGYYTRRIRVVTGIGAAPAGAVGVHRSALGGWRNRLRAFGRDASGDDIRTDLTDWRPSGRFKYRVWAAPLSLPAELGLRCRALG